MMKIISNQKYLFNPEVATKELFEFAYRIVATRSFGYLGPTTMLIPFADCINHRNHDAEYDFYNYKIHNTGLV
jgi:hypothetical protein